MSDLLQSLVGNLRPRDKEAQIARLQKKRESWKNNSDLTNLRRRETRERLRADMIEAYGSKCVECNEDDSIVLVLDHINDDGWLERIQEGNQGGCHTYRKLQKLGWPKDRCQLMCHNCNFRKEYKRRQEAEFVFVRGENNS